MATYINAEDLLDKIEYSRNVAAAVSDDPAFQSGRIAAIQELRALIEDVAHSARAGYRGTYNPSQCLGIRTLNAQE